MEDIEPVSSEMIYYEEEILWLRLCCGLYDADYRLWYQREFIVYE